MEGFSIIPANQYKYNVIKQSFSRCDIYPYLKASHENAPFKMWNVSPQHGRSYIVQKKDNRYVVIKGAGINYSQYQFLRTNESKYDVWGLLLKQDALRDYIIGNEVSKLGIYTNRMHSIIELTNIQFIVDDIPINPVILQYDVVCPYRIEDAPFLDRNQLWKYVNQWDRFNTNNFNEDYMIAAEVLLSNLRKLHDAQILHNAMTTHNYTWSLELLDFEIASSPMYPYTTDDDERHKQKLFQREVLDVYRIIKYIAYILHTQVNERKLEDLFKKYGFYMENFALDSPNSKSTKFV